MIVRHAVASDAPALLHVWPRFTPGGLNLEQVFVCVDDDDAILGAVLVIDGGHEIVYVAEVTIPPGPDALGVTKELLESLVYWGKQANKRLLMFHATDVIWASYMVRCGATVQSHGMLLTHPLFREE